MRPNPLLFLKLLLLFAWLLPLEGHAQAPLPAFPGAEGFGAASIGGRGGQVIEVTSLGNSGPGTLRDAVEASGPRIVVFRVAGSIQLEDELLITNPYLTIAGQTAPGGGVVLRKQGSIDAPLIRLRDGVHNVIIRYLRLRHGVNTPSDNISIRGSHDVILDHLSLSWAPDENMQIYRQVTDPPIQNVTVQRSIVSEGIRVLLSDGLGAIISGDDDRADPNNPIEAWKQVTDISLHHNLFAHNRHRNPRATALNVQIANNVAYNWSTRIGSSTRGAIVDHINNFSLVGPMRIAEVLTDPNFASVRLMRHEAQAGWPDPSLFIVGNIVEPGVHVDPEADNAVIWPVTDIVNPPQPLPPSFQRSTPIPAAPIPVRVESAREAFQSVLADVGANARLDCSGNWVPNADAVDQRIVNEVLTGTGVSAPIVNPIEVGGYPSLDPGTPCPDADHDGMPDAWEGLMGFDPNDPNDGALDADADGYTNVEEYLNGPVPTDPLAAYQWQLDNTGQGFPAGCEPAASCATGTPDADIDAAEASALGYTGKGVVIGLATTSSTPTVNCLHPELADRLWTDPNDPNVHGWNFASGTSEVCKTGDSSSHPDNRVAQHALAALNGVGMVGAAPDAQLMLIAGAEGPLENDDHVFYRDVIPWVESRGARVLIAPYHGEVPTPDCATYGSQLVSGTSQTRLQILNQSELLVLWGCPGEFPGCDADTIQLRGTDENDDVFTDSCAVGSPTVDLAVPAGDAPLSGDLQLATAFGFAAGAAALLLEAEPNISRAELTSRMLGTADQVGPFPYVGGRNDEYGVGRLNVFQALLIGDVDGDGIAGDGDGSGVAGDAPCAGSPINCDDNCPLESNPSQSDVGGVGVATPDGIGDACQCGDADDDGSVLVPDGSAIRSFLAAGPEPASLAKCNVIGPAGTDPDDCLIDDWVVIERARLGLSGPPQSCAPALP